MKNIYSLLTFLAVLLLAAQNINAQVSGTVFRDIPVNGTSQNTYGVKDGNEIGVGGVTVTVYPGGATTTTASDGSWSIAGTGAVRVEFSNWPTYLRPSPDASNSKTSVQFVTAPSSNVDFGLHDPNDYNSSTLPPYVMSLNTSGTGTGNTIMSLVTNQYNDNGLNPAYDQYDGTQGTGDSPTIDALAQELGAVWGKGYQQSQKTMYVSSVLQRHIGFASGNPGRIWAVDYTSSPGNVLGSIDLQGVSPANGGAVIDFGSVNRSGADNELHDSPQSPSRDIDAYGKIGTVSYGDIDFDNNTEKLWAVNLYQKGIISIDASGGYANMPGTVNQYLIENLSGAPNCSGGELRPWGFGIHNGKGFVGIVCDASTSQNYHDLKAYVLSFDLNNPAAGFATELSIDMDYDRSGDDGYSENDHWFPWTDQPQDVSGNWDGYNQPVLSDIDFDEEGNMYLGFLDRWGLQAGYKNNPPVSGTSSLKEKAYGQGEIWKACYSGGSYSLEGTGGCPSGTTPDGDFFDDRGGDNNAHGASGGSMAILTGSNQMIYNVNDPHPSGSYGSKYWVTNGVQTFNTTNGEIDNWYSLVFSGTIEYTGKAAGIGDIEFLTDPVPIEIGNLVWEDTNGNGIQDADESGISGVEVKLIKGGAEIASATTDAQGNYIFSNASGNSTLSHKYGISALESGMAYEVKIPDISGGNKQAALGVATLTTPDVGEGTNTDKNDSDGAVSGDDAVAQVNNSDVPVPGANNHSFDFGFIPIPPCSITDAGKTNESCNNAGTGSDPADDYISFDLNPTASNNGATYNVTVNNVGTVTPTSGTYGSATSFRLQDGSATGATYTITLTDVDNPNCTIETTVNQGSCSDECLLQDGGLTGVNCSNTGADDNDGNDYIIFDLNPTGLNLGAAYNVTVNVGTVTLADGSAATFLSYGSVKHFRLQDGSAGGGNVIVTVTDNGGNGCSIDVPITDPGSCSSTCAVPYEICPGESFEAIVQGTDIDVNTIQWYKSSDGGINFYPIAPPDGVDQNLTITEVGEYYYIANGLDGCIDSLCCHIIVEAGNCPGCQLLTPGLDDLTCNDNGTPQNAADDFISFSLDPQGNQTSTGYTVTADNGGIVSPGNGTYGAPSNFQMQQGSADGTLYTITITDNDDPNCVITTTVQLSNCGVTCAITDATIQNVQCHNSNTNGNANDDFLTFDMTVTGNFTGGTYSVSASSGGITPSSGTYDNVNSFTLTPGSAGGGNVIITITDVNDPNCTATATVVDPGSCSICDLTVDAGSNENVCEGSCVDLTATASGGSGIYNYLWSNGGNSATINVCPTSTTTYAVTVTDSEGCQAESRVKVFVESCAFDLALKLTTTQTLPVRPGNIVPFTITVCNQSDITVETLELTDYIPAGFSLADPTWTAGVVGHTGVSASKTFSVVNGGLPGGGLAGGQCLEFDINLEVNSHANPDDFTNYAEITDAVDEFGYGDDEDSTPGSDSAWEQSVGCGDADDDNMDGKGQGGVFGDEDEDDHDPACVDIFDLALKKVETSTGPYKFGDPVTFTYTIYNQGNIAATNIEVTDYVPSGFEYDPALNASWSQSQTTTPTTVITTALNPGENTTVTLVLKAQYTADQVDGWTNVAEISNGEDLAGHDLSNKDYDSILDDDPYNDAGGKADSPSDDVVDGDGTGTYGDTDPATDEDDADPARVKIYDLALRKVLLTPEPYQYYNDLTFEITVFNQGNEAMTNIEVSDYIPEGYTFDSGMNAGWNGAAPTVSTSIAGPLAPGDSAKVQIVLKLVQTNGGETDWDNYVEITGMSDSAGTPANSWDADSTPDTDAAHERDVKPEDPDDDNIDGHYIPDGTDEDDHDPAGIHVLDLALTKTTDAVAPYQYDQIVDFTFTIYNQGNEIAHDIEVVDYVPSGFIYLPHINPNWTQELVDTPKMILPNTLLPGEFTTVMIKLQFQYTTEVGGYINKAEIVNAKDEEDNDFDDIDSTPDDDPDNDIGGTPLTPEDDNVSDDGTDGDGDGVTDEDDEDPWATEVASIGNYVWYDDNDNGVQDEGQPGDFGVDGVTVILKDCHGKEILRTQTDGNGHYDFENLIPGEYLIVFDDLPENSEWAKQNQGNDNLDSDADEDGITICTELEAGEDDPSWDAGILRYSSLGDYVWLDTDSDGVQDPEEDQISGVVVKLLDENGNVLETTTTDEQGYYLFDSLHPGTYIVEFETPDGLTPTDKSQGANLDKDSDPNPGTGRTDSIVLGANEDRRDIDAGYKCGLELEITPNDVLCEGESKDVEVTVIDGTGLVIYDWSTGEHTASITVVPNETTIFSVTVTDENGCSGIIKDTITVEPRAKIGDYVWLDLDRDGVQDFYIDDPDLNEPGINGVTVNLYQASDPNTIYTTQLTHVNVDTSGFYEFDVCAGDYFVEFIAPTGQGYIFTQQDQGPDDRLDSDADENTGRTITFHVDPEDIDHTRDAGFYTTASIGDFVWHDIDADGIQDDGEEGIDGVEVTLHRADGSIVGTTTTSNGGKYEFTGLIPDDYYVCFDYSGTNYTQISPKDQGYDDTVDSDVDPASGCTEITEILAGENDVRWDMGLYTLASLGDYVWYDKDADGCQDADEVGIEGVTVRLYKDTDSNGIPDGGEIANTQTDNTGFYEFLELPAGTYVVKFEKPNSDYKVSPKNHNGADGCDDASDSDGDGIMGYSDPIELSDNEHDPTIDQGYYETARLGDYVWYDKDGDGIQGPEEEGVSGVTVTLYKDTDGDGVPETPVETRVTNTGGSAGSYVFEDVEPGVYKICFDTDGEYDGFTKTDEGGDDAVDSDVDQQSGCTEVIVVESGDDDMTNDAGLIKYAELGDYVWEDKNADGYQDPTELPIANVMVILKDGNGNELDTTYTDADGLYIFDELLPGDYIVHFEKPAGYEPTDKDAVASDTKDSDADPIGGDSHLVTLEAGDSDMTIDAGFYKPASLGDYVWEDKDADGIQDPDEDGINGIVVTLYDENGDPVANTTTGVNPNTGDDGFYEFTDLEPGVYHVCFDKGSYDKISDKDVGSDNAIDSDADIDTGCTEILVLESGEHDPTLDAGLYNLASLGDYVWLDLNGDGIQDGNEVGINDLIVELYIDEDGDGNPDDTAPLKTTTTSTNNGTDGYYIFEDLEPGNYIVKFPTVDAYEITKSDEQGDDARDSDADETTGWSATINLESGEHDPTIDAGYFNAASLGDYVWYDEDGDGIQDASEKCIDSVKIYLYSVIDNAGVLDTTKIDSTWSHAVLNPDDITDTLNCGYYEFTRLIPGDYFLVFENPDDTKYQISPKDELFDDSKDTDIDEFGNTPTITLDPGEHNPTIDAGFYKGECLEGALWKDREEGYFEIQPDLTKLYTVPNVHDVLDQPYPGIVVELYLDGDEFDPSDDVLALTTVTDADGIYDFKNIKKGNYYIVVNLPDDYEVVSTDVGGDDTQDSDFYLSEETGQYRSYTFLIEAENDEECITDVDGGTKERGQTQPITIVDFGARWNKGEEVVDLLWVSMDEIDMDYFNIERRAEDEEEFVEIASMDSKGGRFLTKYGLKDPNVEGGMTYHYRLIPINENGRSDKVYNASVFIPSDKFTVKAYPNPVTDRMYVLISGSRDNDVSIEIVDNVGRRVMDKMIIENSNTTFEKVSMNLRDLPQGQYYIKVVSGDRVEIKKLIHVR